jgi:hypothetical protein
MGVCTMGGEGCKKCKKKVSFDILHDRHHDRQSVPLYECDGDTYNVAIAVLVAVLARAIIVAYTLCCVKRRRRDQWVRGKDRE